MTSPNPMTSEELLELAALDAFGLLDEYEAALFTRSFHHAPASVQDELIRLQAEVASDETLLGDESPSPALRERVLRAVSRAIDEDDRGFAPLATIGRQRMSGGDQIVRRRLTLSGNLWRAAALVMFGASIVLSFFTIQAWRHANEIAELALNNNTDAYLEELIGPTFREFVGNPGCDVISFEQSAGSDTPAIARLYVNRQLSTAFLLAIDLPLSSSSFAIRAITVDGQRAEVKTVKTTKQVSGWRLDGLTAALLATTTSWEIVDDAGQVLMHST